MFASLFTLTMMQACSFNQKSENNAESMDKKNCIEVLYFHGKQRCVTCRAIEILTREVLETDFAKEQKAGKIVFRVIDISQKENEAIAEKYEIAWSSLILDKSGKVVNLTDMGFSHAKNNPDIFKQKLREELNKVIK